MFFVYLLSGLFLGWSLGANDAANVYGTAVGSRMLRFRTAAVACSVFVIVGAVLGGAGAAHTLGKLGSVNALPGSFTVALAAALSVTAMTRLGLPVSTSQAIVGAIIGWNFFAGAMTDWSSLSRIVGSWVVCPLLSAAFAAVMLKIAQAFLARVPVRIFRLDNATRVGLFVVGILASYSLGANNIANVVGVFVPANPLAPFTLPGGYTLSGAQQLFLLGGIAIAVGVFTYSKRVMLTVGNEVFKLSPVAALIVVLAQAIVLFLFASESLESWLAARGLPTIPLVPVSSSQAVIGAVIGIGLAKGGRNIRYGVLARIASGWVSTPLLSGAMAFVLLFFVQNVFAQQVFAPVRYAMSGEVAARLQREGLYADVLEDLIDEEYADARAFRRALREAGVDSDLDTIARYARVTPLRVDVERIRDLWDGDWLSEEQLQAVFRLQGRAFEHGWQLDAALAALSPAWRPLPDTKVNKPANKALREKLDFLHAAFAVPDEADEEPGNCRCEPVSAPPAR